MLRKISSSFTDFTWLKIFEDNFLEFLDYRSKLVHYTTNASYTVKGALLLLTHDASCPGRYRYIF
jgi:hypothetical protein